MLVKARKCCCYWNTQHGIKVESLHAAKSAATYNHTFNFNNQDNVAIGSMLSSVTGFAWEQSTSIQLHFVFFPLHCDPLTLGGITALNS